MTPGTSGQRYTAHTDWRTDPLTARMAALATLGFQIIVEQHFDDLTGTARTVFHHAPITRDPRRASLPHAKPLIRLFISGDMERLDPEHPFLDALAAIANFQALEAWRLKNTTACLAADAMPTGQPPLMARRTRLLPGIPPQEKQPHHDLANAANAAALARLGVPVLALVAAGGSPCSAGVTYRLAATGLSLNQQPPIHTPTLLQQAKDGTLPWDHPFHTARTAVLNYLQLLKTCADARQHTLITWRSRRTTRTATLLSSATSKARDLALRHMK